MIFLWILGILVGILILICLLPLRVRMKLSDSVSVTAGIGALPLIHIPKKPEKPVNLTDFTYKKHQKRLQKEKAAQIKTKSKKQKKAAAKAHKKTKAEAKKQAVAAAAKNAHQKENKLEGILDLVFCILHVLPGFFGGFKCRIYKMEVTVGGKEAADIAKNFGILSQSAAYLFNTLAACTHFVKPRPGAVTIRADFLLAKTQYDLDLYLQIRVGQILGTGFSFLFAYLKKQIS